MILNIEDLIDWARDSYYREEKKRQRRESIDVTNSKKHGRNNIMFSLQYMCSNVEVCC